MDINGKRVDREASNGGVWVDWIDGAKLKIRRNESVGYMSQLKKSKALEEIAKIGDFADLPAEKDEELSCKILAECTLVDWSGIEENGKEFKYSVQNAEDLLLDVPELRAFVQAQANTVSNFYKKRAETASKN